MSSLQLRPFLLIFKSSSRGHLPPCPQPSRLPMKWSKFTRLLHMPNTQIIITAKSLLSLSATLTFRSRFLLIPPRFQRHFRNRKSLLLCSSWMVASSPATETSRQLESLSKEGASAPTSSRNAAFLQSELTMLQKCLNHRI